MRRKKPAKPVKSDTFQHEIELNDLVCEPVPDDTVPNNDTAPNDGEDIQISGDNETNDGQEQDVLVTEYISMPKEEGMVRLVINEVAQSGGYSLNAMQDRDIDTLCDDNRNVVNIINENNKYQMNKQMLSTFNETNQEEDGDDNNDEEKGNNLDFVDDIEEQKNNENNNMDQVDIDQDEQNEDESITQNAENGSDLSDNNNNDESMRNDRNKISDEFELDPQIISEFENIVNGEFEHKTEEKKEEKDINTKVESILDQETNNQRQSYILFLHVFRISIYKEI